MPLQPPNPEFLAQAPGPEAESGAEETPQAPEGMTAGYGWRRPAELAGVVFVLLAAIFGMADLIT
jgi:hypothetical protein